MKEIVPLFYFGTDRKGAGGYRPLIDHEDAASKVSSMATQRCIAHFGGCVMDLPEDRRSSYMTYGAEYHRWRRYHKKQTLLIEQSDRVLNAEDASPHVLVDGQYVPPKKIKR